MKNIKLVIKQTLHSALGEYYYLKLKYIWQLTIKRMFYKAFGEKKYLKLIYLIFFKKLLNLDNPQKFSEKLFWLKVYNKKFLKPLIQLCYDKYTVRQYLKEKDCEKYLNELYGVYGNADEIDFDKLPDSFIIKITQSCGFNMVIKNKNSTDFALIRKTVNLWLNLINKDKVQHPPDEGYAFNGNAKIICEKLLYDKNGNFPNDYRIFCFNGEPKLIVCDLGTTNKDGTHGNNIIRNTYDLNWNLLPVNFGRPHDKNVMLARPIMLPEMLKLSKSLSKDFVFARIDLYNINEKIIFGEITYIPMGGDINTTPIEYDYQFGEWLKLPNVKLF